MIKVRLASGKVELRKPRCTSFGNFVMMEVKVDGVWRIAGDGDEYIRPDSDKVHELSPIYRRH